MSNIIVNLETGERIVSDAPDPSPPSPAESNEYARAMRQAAFQQEADPLFFQEQRGEVPEGTWQAKVDEIRARFPYQEV